MEFHIARTFRDRFDMRDLLFSFTGNVIFGNVAASRRLAQSMNDARLAMGGPTPQEAPESVVHAGQLFAMGLIDELSHAVIERYRAEQDPDVLKDALHGLANAPVQTTWTHCSSPLRSAFQTSRSITAS